MAEKRNVKIRNRGRDILQVTWPGESNWPCGVQTFGLLALKCNEIQDAQFATVKHFQGRAQEFDGVNFPEFAREKELQEVFLSMLDPDVQDPKLRLFKTADAMRREMDLNEIAWVSNQHSDYSVTIIRERGLISEIEKAADGS